MSFKEFEAKKQELVKQFNNLRGKGPIKLKKSTSNLFRNRENKIKPKLDVKQFNKVISINPKDKTAEIEGMATYETIVDETLKHNLVPAIAPELKSITIGGAVSGIGIESSSFKYGFVHETVLEMDILTGNGEVITCSKDKNSDLFYAIPNSYGTLGYVLRVKIILIPTKKYVKIIRKKYSDYNKYVNDIKKYSLEARKKRTYDYIDGLAFNKNELYLHLCKFVDKAEFVSDYTYMKIYYKSMDKPLDYMKTRDYIFRYDTDWFWTTKAMGLENPILRFLVGRKNLRSDFYYKLLKFEAKYQILTTINKIQGYRSETLIQDAEVEDKDAAEFIKWFHAEITDFKPLTVGCVIPYNKTAKFTLFPMNPKKVYFNIGYYASVPTNKEDGYYNRLFEKKLMSLNAKKMMYSRSLYSEKEFWNIFDLKSYTKLKAKYDKDKVFLNLYEKCVLKK